MPRPRVISEPLRITVTFDRDDYESLRAIAAKQRETSSGVVRKAVRDWLRGTTEHVQPKLNEPLGRNSR